MANCVTVVGQGYVGLPLAQAAVGARWKTYGLDVSDSLVESLSSGRSHIDDLTDDEVAEMLTAGYSPTTDSGVIGQSNVVVICVPTPLDDDSLPDLRAVREAAAAIGSNMRMGTLVVLESTTYPGSTERVLVPILENVSGLSAGRDFFVAFSPERVDPGRQDFGMKNTPKLVGGIDAESTRRAEAFYGSFVDEVVLMKGTREAETAKLLENTFRHVNIALVNEMAKFCHELEIDIWDVIRGAASKPFGFMSFSPGPGVGGHCIPIDPNYLSHEVRRVLGYPFRFVELAQEINNSMPSYVVRRIQDILNDDGKALKGSRVLLLGVTYKPNIADQRESPAVPVAEALRRKGAEVMFHDPMVATWTALSPPVDRVADLAVATRVCDIAVVLQDHSDYELGELAEIAPSFLDTRGQAGHVGQRL